jgi:hypothetical protein
MSLLDQEQFQYLKNNFQILKTFLTLITIIILISYKEIFLQKDLENWEILLIFVR